MTEAPPEVPQADTSPKLQSPYRNKTTFTPEMAREMAVKRREAAEARRLAALNPPEPIPNQGQTSAIYGGEELELVQEQITRVRDQLRCKMEPNERAQLVRALDLMLDRKRILQQQPLPGSRRPAAETTRPRGSSLMSSEAAPPTPQASRQEQE